MSDVYETTMTSGSDNSPQGADTWAQQQSEQHQAMLAEARAESARQEALGRESIAAAERANQENIRLATDSLEFQKAVDERNFKYMVERQQLEDMRADTKFQRGVKDARAAGLSPLAVLGNMSTSGNVVSQASGVNPVVPQQDPSALVNSYGNMIHGQASMQALKTELQAEIIRTDSASARIDKQSRYDQVLQRERLNAQYSNVMSQLESDQKIALERIKAENERHRADLQHLSRQLDFEERESIAKGYRQAGYQVEYVNASSEKINEHNLRAIQRDEATTEIYLKDAIIWSRSQGSNASVSASLNLPGQNGSGAPGVAGSAGSGDTSSYYENPVKVFEERLKQSRAKNVIWIYSKDGKKI